MANEIPLTGGNTTQGVVRVGDTVRRPLKPASKSVRKLLLHLEAQGFTNAPRFLGVDEKYREILSYIEGSTGSFDFIWSDNRALLAIARLLREYHSAVSGFDFSQLDWAYEYSDADRHELVCHNDFAPYNMVFGDSISIIDFDLAGPGPKLRDVAYSAYWAVPLAFGAGDLSAFACTDLENGSQRLKLFCSEYGVEVDESLIEMVSEVLCHMADKDAALRMLGEDVAHSLEEGGHFAHWRAEYLAFKSVRARIVV